jgi:hypothetical protein
MKILSITLLVSTVLGSIGLAGCQTTEEDYYYSGQPRRVVSTEETVYVRRPQWGGDDYRPAPVYRERWSEQRQPRYQEPRYQPQPPRHQPAPPPPPRYQPAPPPPPQHVQPQPQPQQPPPQRRVQPDQDQPPVIAGPNGWNGTRPAR